MVWHVFRYLSMIYFVNDVEPWQEEPMMKKRTILRRIVGSVCLPGSLRIININPFPLFIYTRNHWWRKVLVLFMLGSQSWDVFNVRGWISSGYDLEKRWLLGPQALRILRSTGGHSTLGSLRRCEHRKAAVDAFRGDHRAEVRHRGIGAHCRRCLLRGWVKLAKTEFVFRLLPTYYIYNYI